jgi:magnesium transporter
VAKSPSEAPAGAADLQAGRAPISVVRGHDAPDESGRKPSVPRTRAADGIRLFAFEAGKVRILEGDAALAELPGALRRPDARLWIDVTNGSPQLNTQIGDLLGLHPLLVEDICERDERAKLEQVGEFLHLVLFSLGFDDGQIFERELDFVLGRRFLLTNHSRWWDPTATRHLRVAVGDVMSHGLDHLLWALADDVIDDYFPILDQLGDEIDDLEDRVVASADRSLLERIFELKREAIQVRRVTSPEREMFNILSSREGTLISEPERLYFRDAYDHLIRLTDELDTYRELASATLETYLSTVNNNLSLIMKRLTGVTVVVAGIGAIGGLFGMSEAQFAFRGDEGPGFWIILFASLALSAIAVAILRRIDWI